MLSKKNNFDSILSFLRTKYHLPIPQTQKSVWRSGIKSELKFWDHFFQTKGALWPQGYGYRLDPNFPLQPYITGLLPNQKDLHILDVGAGPLTHLGKQYDGRSIKITAVDPLAGQYSEILKKHGIVPLVETETGDAEVLSSRFSEGTFDLAHARNCLDHSYDPAKAIDEMLFVVKEGCCVVLQHRMNEALTRNFRGLHQWNFCLSENGDFLIRSHSSEINISNKYNRFHNVESEYDSDNNWLLTKIKKGGPIHRDDSAAND